VPVDLRVVEGRVVPAVEAAIYFTVAEARTNVAKHSHAELVSVQVELEDSEIIARVADDGVGGVRVTAGSGLTASTTGWTRSAEPSLSRVPPAGERPSVLGFPCGHTTNRQGGTHDDPCRETPRIGIVDAGMIEHAVPRATLPARPSGERVR
jgi:hypothetical protein